MSRTMISEVVISKNTTTLLMDLTASVEENNTQLLVCELKRLVQRGIQR